MAYRRVYKGRKGKGKRRTYRKGKSTVKGLAKRVNALSRSMRMKTEYQHLGGTINSTIGSILPPGISIFNLCNWNSYSSIFGSFNTDVDLGNSYYHKSFGLDLTFEPNNETDNVSYTVFLVSLKDSIGSAFDSTNGTLSLNSPQHFWANQGMIMLNKKVFNIHKVKRFHLGNFGAPLTQSSANQYGTIRRFYWKWFPKCKVINPVASVKLLNSSIDPSKQYFLLVCNDDSSADLASPVVRGTIVHTFTNNM